MIAESLKKALLQAAIQGKLTEQLPEDGDARDLLREIQKEKARLIKEGKIKKQKPLPEITEDEIPFDIPENWVWARLGNVTNYGVGRQVKPVDIPQNSWVLELEDIDKNAFHVNSKKVDRIAGSNKNYFPKDDVLYGKLRPYLKKVLVAEQEGYCSTEIIPFNGYGLIHSKYLMYYLVSPSTDGYINNITHGMDMPRLGTDKARQLLLPIPPISEQKRIVKKIEELLPEIEALKAEENKLDNLEKAFPNKIRASILQAAIQGKLTEQLPEDGDARDLLKEIQKEKARLIREGKIKKEKPLPEITENEIPFDIPDNWVWVRLGDIIFNRGQKKPSEKFTYIDISSIDNIKNTLGDLSNTLNPNEAPSRARKIVREGDVIYATVRPYLHNICLIDRNIEPEPIVSTGFAVVTSTTQVINRFLFRCFLSPMFDDYANSNDNSKGVAYPAINDQKFNRALIPLPPLSEQKRIVENLEDLLPLCTSLEETIL